MLYHHHHHHISIFSVSSLLVLVLHLHYTHAAEMFKLQGSHVANKPSDLEMVGPLSSEITLSITIVTGALEKSQSVANYYGSIQGLAITDITEMHVKLNGTVGALSNAFDTTFTEYDCPARSVAMACFASDSDISIPAALKSSIIGILGLETIQTARPH